VVISLCRSSSPLSGCAGMHTCRMEAFSRSLFPSLPLCCRSLPPSAILLSVALTDDHLERGLGNELSRQRSQPPPLLSLSLAHTHTHTHTHTHYIHRAFPYSVYTCIARELE